MLPVASLAAAFVSPLCYGWSNIFDNRLNKALPNNLTFLISVSKLMQGLLVLPLFLFLPVSLYLSPATLAALLAVITIEFLYIYPYLWSLKRADTSIVAALFSLGEIFVPFLAWLFLHESLQPTQYLGFVVILLASLLLTFQPGKLHLNLSALFMLLASLMLSVSAIVTKYTFQSGINWATFTVWCMALEGLVGAVILALRPRQSANLWRQHASTRKFFAAEALLSCIGGAGGLLAISLLPVTIFKAISGTQPLFIMLYATLLGRRFPDMFNEARSGLTPAIKLAAFVLTILGTLLTLGH